MMKLISILVQQQTKFQSIMRDAHPNTPAVAAIENKVNHLLHKQIKNIKILEALGTGANATVYLGEMVEGHPHHHHKLLLRKSNSSAVASDKIHHYVAIKQLHTEDKKHVQHLMEEYCIASQLQHENIVKVLDLFYEHYWCYVSEFAGSDLFSKIQSNMTTLECNAAFKQLLSAINYIHDMGICHRDIKPENIVVKDGICKICDFGLAVRFKSVFDEDDLLINGIEGSDPYMVSNLSTNIGTRTMEWSLFRTPC